MTNLVPEQRADKNGKIVTRHVKVDSGITDEKSFPVPVLSPADARTANGMEALRNSLVMNIMDAVTDYDNIDEDFNDDAGLRSDGIYMKLSEYSDFTIIEIDELAQHGPLDRFRSVARLVEQQENDDFISNFIAFGDVEDDSDFPERNVALVRSLVRYPHLAQYEGRIVEAELEVKDGVRALLKVAGVINDMIDDGEIKEGGVMELLDGPHDDISSVPVIQDAALIDFVMKNPERAGDIARVIKERKVFDPSFIEEVMDHPEQALSSGKL